MNTRKLMLAIIEIEYDKGGYEHGIDEHGSYRMPVSESRYEYYTALFDVCYEDGDSLDDMLHDAIVTALVSEEDGWRFDGFSTDIILSRSLKPEADELCVMLDYCEHRGAGEDKLIKRYKTYEEKDLMGLLRGHNSSSSHSPLA